EVRRACDLLGVGELHFLGLDDAVLRLEDDHVRRLARLLRQVKPDVILTHFPREGDTFANPHAIAGQIVLHAVHLAAAVDPGDRHPPHKVAQVFFFGIGAAGVRCNVWDSEGGYTCDVFVDIEDVVEKKLAALDCLDSQGYAGPYARKRLEASDGAFGAAARCAYAEGFIRMNHEVHQHLPVTARALELAAESDHQVIERMARRLDPATGRLDPA
ncbi:MAG: PIG-L family deacetylase, partial [Gemmatimonadota bacterium]